ncbi:ABC transporter D family member 1-like [Gossypium australe]|uniref:ABC transporter D family member 1-like n=1 Tax=Gossypium australe TaxID=47621 RepID=A0A5B6VY06_9ROSI|nr:ABC transporter D family member 1-like [Gossypium australe]
MLSLQLLQLTDRGRNVLASRSFYPSVYHPFEVNMLCGMILFLKPPSWKAILLASGIVVAGGTAYLQSRFSSKKPYSYGHSNGVQDDRENSDEVLKRNNNVKGTTRKRGGLKSLQVLTAILLSKMGQTGARDLLALVGIVVLRTALTNRLAKVQGFLFRAAFLQRVPSFFMLISENILLCFLLSTFHSTSKYITGTLSLSFRKILTKLIHTHYFEVVFCL